MSDPTHDEVSARNLERSQMALSLMFQANQDALVSRVDALLKPMQTQLADLQATVDGIGRQIDQLHLRQEAQERALSGEPNQERTAP